MAKAFLAGVQRAPGQGNIHDIKPFIKQDKGIISEIGLKSKKKEHRKNFWNLANALWV
jgi:hypothetical protein